MARGRLEPPNLDDRTWREIVDQARALIPRYAPEWTDHNPSDLGMTLIELFAWLVEGLIYRLNRVPEKTYIEFLNLLGITRAPATPATTWLTYQLASGSGPVTILKGSQAATPQTEKTEAVVFETDADLRVLPINLTTALLIRNNEYQDITGNLVAAPLGGLTLQIDTGETVIVALGFDQPITEVLRLHVQVRQPLQVQIGQPPEPGAYTISWQCSPDDVKPDVKPTGWGDVRSADDGTAGLQRSGIVELRMPEHSGEKLHWLGLKLEVAQGGKPATVALAHILFNSVSATNALSVRDEEIGTSDGTPFQSFELDYRPLFKRPGVPNPYDHLAVEIYESQVGGAPGTWRAWTAVEDLPAGEGRFFLLDPVTGTLQFGSDDAARSTAGHGSIPPAGSKIRASYRYVAGGARGNVDPKMITVLRTATPGVSAVTNMGAAAGGADEETSAETLRRAPEMLRNRGRAVTAEDYEYLAREASPSVRKVRCLPPWPDTGNDDKTGIPGTYGGLPRGTGHVNLIVVPVSTLSVAMPKPSADLIQQIQDYLDGRRALATRLHVTTPRYLPINVQADVRIWQKVLDTQLVTEARVREEVTNKIDHFLHPLLGGLSGQGWEVGQDFVVSDLLEFIKLDSSIGFISKLEAQAGTPDYQPSNRPFANTTPDQWFQHVQLADYELLCGGTHTVNINPSSG